MKKSIILRRYVTLNNALELQEEIDPVKGLTGSPHLN